MANYDLLKPHLNRLPKGYHSWYGTCPDCFTNLLQVRLWGFR